MLCKEKPTNFIENVLKIDETEESASDHSFSTALYSTKR